MLYCIVLYCIVLYYIVLYCIVLYCIVLYCIVLYCILLYCIVLYLYCFVLYFIVLYCIVLYCIVLFCIVLKESLESLSEGEFWGEFEREVGGRRRVFACMPFKLSIERSPITRMNCFLLNLCSCLARWLIGGSGSWQPR